MAFLSFLGIAERTDHASDWYYVGYSLLPIGGFGKALEIFKKSLARDSENSNCHAMIALLHAASPNNADRNGAEALEIMKTLESSERAKTWSFFTIYAAAYAEVGDFKSALQQLKKALEHCPEKSKRRVLARVAEYQQNLPFRLSVESVREHLKECGQCLRCGGNVSISRSGLCVRCLQSSKT